jgi:hypothetical protein
MTEIHNITSENFNESFDLNCLLKNSAFYPASGIDGTHLEELSNTGIKSFVHVDYSEVKEVVEKSLRNDFTALGYKLVGIIDVPKDQLTPNGFASIANIPLNSHENDRIKHNKHIRDRISHKDFTPYAIWAVYELDSMATGDTRGKMDKFSILHIGGEACATFDALYLSNGINPSAIIILNPSEGYGDNWTRFTNPDFRLYQMLKSNVDNNSQVMPKYLLANGNQNQAESAFWSNYVSEYTRNSHYLTTDEYNNVRVSSRWIELFLRSN